MKQIKVFHDLREEPRMTAGKTAKVASRARLARGERERQSGLTSAGSETRHPTRNKGRHEEAAHRTTETMKRIIVDHGTRKRLMEEGYGSYPTIREALNCLSNTEVARKIRQRALQLGGVVMETEHVAVVKKREA